MQMGAFGGDWSDFKHMKRKQVAVQELAKRWLAPKFWERRDVLAATEQAFLDAGTYAADPGWLTGVAYNNSALLRASKGTFCYA